MKPLFHLTDLAPIKVQMVQLKPRMVRIWMKVEGRLECRWIEERR